MSKLLIRNMNITWEWQLAYVFESSNLEVEAQR